jgi:hypothetical protein
MPLAGMYGRVPTLAVEAVPSRVATTSLLLGFEMLLWLTGLDSLAVVRRRWWFYSRGGACWWAVEFGGAH